jgi:8-amino-7-oxononanoate synthase
MDGDLADLPTIVALAKRYDAWVMVDDAHGLGVLGKTGRGTLQYFGLTVQDVPILMGTLGKAFGVFGAFVAGSELLIEVLIQNARSYIYTTALPPALAAATEVSLQLADSETWRREQLKTLITYLQAGAARRKIPLQPSITPIQVLMLGSAERALAVSAALLAKGILVTAIRPPTVPANTARLRITLSALHQIADVERLLNALAEVLAT